MPAKLTTHVLDTAAGRPAAGMKLELFRAEGAKLTLIKSARTNADGRLPDPLLEGKSVRRGDYVLLFYVGDYFAKRRSPDARKFLNRVPIVFSVADAKAHYHVPLLVSPWSYSTYRGS
ncbi:MAG TPA: hydroxyisourate hydrolase [Tepidisphaeraceae bacterium]|nr:hydroxyisourate hydrolase [Tepidisphaeraceae bacterium]